MIWDFGIDKVGQSEEGANVSAEGVSGDKQRRGRTTHSEESQDLEKRKRTPENLFSLNLEFQTFFPWNKLLNF